MTGGTPPTGDPVDLEQLRVKYEVEEKKDNSKHGRKLEVIKVTFSLTIIGLITLFAVYYVFLFDQGGSEEKKIAIAWIGLVLGAVLKPLDKI